MDNNTGTELEQPLISVVIAVYNGQDAVGRAISSVLRQTHPNIEMVIVDDGSTDNTSRVLEGYGALSRPGREIRLLRQENAGCAAAARPPAARWSAWPRHPNRHRPRSTRTRATRLWGR